MWLTMTAVIFWLVVPLGLSYSSWGIDDAGEIPCWPLNGGYLTDSVIELDVVGRKVAPEMINYSGVFYPI